MDCGQEQFSVSFCQDLATNNPLVNRQMGQLFLWDFEARDKHATCPLAIKNH